MSELRCLHTSIAIVSIIKGFRTIVFIFICYFHKVSTDMSSDLLQVFVELEDLHETSNYIFYWIHGGRLFWSR